MTETDELDKEISLKISASSNDPADLMRDAYILMFEHAKRIELKNSQMRLALQGVLNSALHPEIAIRAAMVQLAPVREALKDS